MPEKITLYGHAACPMLPPVWIMLKQAKVDFEYINIHQDETGRQRVLEINNGYASVPTLEFPDGSTLTEPSASKLSKKLREYGYEVSLLGWLLGNSMWIITGLIILYAILSFIEVI
jgi:mycoredoxin